MPVAACSTYWVRRSDKPARAVFPISLIACGLEGIPSRHLRSPPVQRLDSGSSLFCRPSAVELDSAILSKMCEDPGPLFLVKLPLASVIASKTAISLRKLTAGSQRFDT